MRRLAALLIVLTTSLPIADVRADSSAPLGQIVGRFATDSYADTISAIEDLSRSGAPTAAAIVEALADGRLFFDAASKVVLYKDTAGRAFDAATGASIAAPPATLATVRLNNRVRSIIQQTLAGLGLSSTDTAVRRAAAAAVLKSRDAAAMPGLVAALAKETDPGVRRLLETASAAIALSAADTGERVRIDAIATLVRQGDASVLPVLQSLPANTSPEVRAAAQRAIAEIEKHKIVVEQIQNVWYGLSLGSVLLLAAIGLAITFGVMGIINMAHGEMVMLGAYTTFVVQELFRSYAPAWFGWSLPLAVPLAFLVTALVGVAIERGIIRFLYGRPLETLLATWGVSLVLQQAVRTAFGPTNKEVGAPSYMSGAFDFHGIAITYGRLWIIVFTLVVFTALLVMLKATSLGLKMRAVTQNRRMAASMGIRTPWVDAMTFGLGSGIAGMAGVALSQIDNVSPNLGQSYIIDSFMVVVFGGVGNLWGTLVSAFALGIANKFLEPYAGAVLAKILILVLLILFIQKRPRGLFALKGRAVEA